MQKYCPNCGLELHPNSKYCSECGVRLADFELRKNIMSIEGEKKVEPEVIDIEKAMKSGEVRIEPEWKKSKPNETPEHDDIHAEIVGEGGHKGFEEPALEVLCPMCGTELQIGKELANIRPLELKCKECGNIFVLRKLRL